MTAGLPRIYRYQYCLRLFAGNWNHSYEVIGRWGALNFHVTDLGEDYAKKFSSDQYSAGLECHYRTPPSYMADQPPSQDYCWLLKQPCWHDGTSLYALEVLMPFFDPQNHKPMFSSCFSG